LSSFQARKKKRLKKLWHFLKNNNELVIAQDEPENLNSKEEV